MNISLSHRKGRHSQASNSVLNSHWTDLQLTYQQQSTTAEIGKRPKRERGGCPFLWHISRPCICTECFITNNRSSVLNLSNLFWIHLFSEFYRKKKLGKKRWQRAPQFHYALQENIFPFTKQQVLLFPPLPPKFFEALPPDVWQEIVNSLTISEFSPLSHPSHLYQGEAKPKPSSHREQEQPKARTPLYFHIFFISSINFMKLLELTTVLKRWVTTSTCMVTEWMF